MNMATCGCKINEKKKTCSIRRQRVFTNCYYTSFLCNYQQILCFFILLNSFFPSLHFLSFSTFSYFKDKSLIIMRLQNCFPISHKKELLPIIPSLSNSFVSILMCHSPSLVSSWNSVGTVLSGTTDADTPWVSLW